MTNYEKIENYICTRLDEYELLESKSFDSKTSDEYEIVTPNSCYKIKPNNIEFNCFDTIEYGKDNMNDYLYKLNKHFEFIKGLSELITKMNRDESN